MSFVLYHIAKDPKIQDRLKEEVQESLIKHNGWTYQAVKDMTYLDQVIQGEAMKLWILHELKWIQIWIHQSVMGFSIVVNSG